jgi:hypothetical protein
MTTEINRILDRNGIPRFYYINQVGQTVLLVIEKIKPIRESQSIREKLKRKELQKTLKLILSL